MESNIRVGKVSSINYKNGTVRVTYPDRNDVVTSPLPYLSNGVFKMPNVGQSVLVVHLSNGSENGICIGTFWNEKNKPYNAGVKDYKNRLTENSYISCIDEQIEFSDDSGSIRLSEIIAMKERIQSLENALAGGNDEQNR